MLKQQEIKPSEPDEKLFQVKPDVDTTSRLSSKVAFTLHPNPVFSEFEDLEELDDISKSKVKAPRQIVGKKSKPMEEPKVEDHSMYIF